MSSSPRRPASAAWNAPPLPTGTVSPLRLTMCNSTAMTAFRAASSAEPLSNPRWSRNFCYSPCVIRNGHSRLQGVLFDWDGTLINSFAADSAAYLAYRAAGLPRHRWSDADTAWRKQYARHRPKLIAGARRVLSHVAKRHRLGLVTSGDRDRVLRQLREFRLFDLFSARVCSGDTLRKKPHPEPLRLALRHLALEPRSCIYVGDSPEDLEMARRAGVRAVAVLGPFPTEKRLRDAKPEFLLESITELPALLAQL